MTKEQRAPTYCLIVPTKDRSYHISRRLPIWTRQGFDEVIVVDSSADRAHRERNEELCRETGALYIYAEANRSRARNIGARIANGDWIFFSDDDESGSDRFNRALMDRRIQEADWLKAGTSQVITIFRRSFFLDLGGFKENLVLGEDEDLTERAVSAGRGGPIEGVFGDIAYGPDRYEVSLDFKRRLSNYMEYSFTLWDYLRETGDPPGTALSWGLSLLHIGAGLFAGRLESVPYFLGGVAGLLYGFLTFPFRTSRRKGPVKIPGSDPGFPAVGLPSNSIGTCRIEHAVESVTEELTPEREGGDSDPSSFQTMRM